MTPPRRPRVLILAEAANPEMVSVPLVGWSLAEALRSVADIHLVTQSRNREAILRAGWVEGRDFTIIDSERVARPLWRLTNLLGVGASSGKGWTVSQAISVLSDAYFDRVAWKTLGARVKAGEWDIVHRVTPLSPIKPSRFGRRAASAGVPFVMGPLNGGVPWPAGYERQRGKEREWLSKLRGAVRLIPGRRATWRAASAILVGSRHTGSEVVADCQHKVIYIPENGINPDRFPSSAVSKRSEGPLRACFVGRLVPYKMPDLLIEAAAPLLASGKMRLDVIGNGPMLQELQEMVRQKELTSQVTFHGFLPHTEVAQAMRDCDVLTFPSIREFGGGVVLEAMALGLPPLVVDYAGPGELVDSAIGYKIPICRADELAVRLRATLEQIVMNPAVLSELSQAAKNRVHEKFLWSRKAEQISDVYAWVLGGRPDKPEPFPMDRDQG